MENKIVSLETIRRRTEKYKKEGKKSSIVMAVLILCTPGISNIFKLRKKWEMCLW